MRPRCILISSRQPSAVIRLQQFPFVENYIARHSIQPWVHNCAVTVQEGLNIYRFMVFFKRHHTFGPNRSLQALLQGQPSLVRLDVVVMRIGKASSFVNMRGRDSVLADWLMKK